MINSIKKEMKEICEATLFLLKISGCNRCFNEEEKNTIINAAIIQYLMYLLEFNDATQQSINSFYYQPFVLKNDRQKLSRENISSTLISSYNISNYYRAEKKYLSNILLQNRMELNEHRVFRRAPRRKNGKKE